MFAKKTKSNQDIKSSSDRKPKDVLKPLQWLWKGLKAFGGYFKGSWQELRQVRWPNRRAAWGMTFAVIAFSIFFVILITLLDFGFQKLFELILK